MTTTTIPTPWASAPIPSTDQRSDLVAGFNHVALLTRDLDRLAAFYRDVFDVPLVELPDPRGRHGFLPLGGAADGGLGPVVHAFEVPEQMTGAFPDADTMFRRGRLDHLAIEAAGEPALRELRDRLVERGACDGVVRLFAGWFLSVHVVDPDGLRLEVGCLRTGEVFTDDELEPAG